MYKEVLRRIFEVLFQFSIGDAKCRGGRIVAKLAISFNSLLEMPQDAAETMRVARVVWLSILYWRCWVLWSFECVGFYVFCLCFGVLVFGWAVWASGSCL